MRTQLDMVCPKCYAAPNEACMDSRGVMKYAHGSRNAEWRPTSRKDDKPSAGGWGWAMFLLGCSVA